MILYFSATGNTKWVAQQLSTFISDTRIYSVQNVESDILETLDAEEPLGFCFPIHAWGIPDPMRRFIEKISHSLSTHYIYMVCTCGDDCGKAHREFERLLKRNGNTVQLMASVQMPNTYVNLPGFDVDSTELETSKKQKAIEWVSEISENIKARKNYCCVTEGAFPHTKSSLLKYSFKRFLVKDRFFRVNKNCIGCGLCANKCPVGNILMEGTHPVWIHNGLCLTCMACYHYCPQKAIRFGKYTENKGQYYFK